MNLCVLLTVWAMPFALATSSGEVAENLRRGGWFFPCTWQVRSGICKEANDIEPEDFGQDKTLSYEDIREKLSEGVTYVLLPERRKSAVDFVQESIRISGEMEISLTIKQFKSHFSAFFTFPYGGNYGCFKDAIKYADEIHFFTNKSNDEITMAIDHYTHAVYRHGIQFHP